MGYIKPKASFIAGLAVAAVLALAGCAGSAPSGPVDWDDDLDFGVPGQVLEVHEGVEFYPACGDEVLTWDDAAYFPYNPARLNEFPDPAEQVSLASALQSFANPGWARLSVPLPAIVLPEPGDDTGTLVIYEGGHAYWESVNGELSTWLTTVVLTYPWVC